MQTKDDAPVEAGLVEPRIIVRAGKCGHHFNPDCGGCSTAIDFTDRELDSLRALIQSQSAEIAYQRNFANDRIAEAKTWRHRAVVAETALTAATEGQSYWQARAERFEAGLRKAQANLSWLAPNSDAYTEIEALLADAQQTQKPEEVRDVE